MNMNAVVLAADSAMTVRYWENGEQKTRYYKGSNKIFQLSDYHPVGMMIFDAASLQEVPWEIIVKEFRRHLGKTEHPNLKAYADALFQFIKSDPLCFPTDYRKKKFLDLIETAVLVNLRKLEIDLKLEAAPTAPGEKNDAIEATCKEQIESLKKKHLPKLFTADADQIAFTDYRADLLRVAQENIDWMKKTKRIHLDYNLDSVLLAEWATLKLYRDYADLLGCTGVVLGGYGRDELYPSYAEFKCYGLLLDEFVFDETMIQHVNPARPSVVKPFATTAMVNTFLMGFNEEVFNTVAREFVTTAEKLAEDIKKELKVEGDIPNLNHHIGAQLKNYIASWTRQVADAHYHPLRDVVASLPVDEIAELAETLIMLESLKEKVTAPTQSVGGPIDVAVISRNEGFVWMKRKHYFDASKNPRYFLRQQQKY